MPNSLFLPGRFIYLLTCSSHCSYTIFGSLLCWLFKLFCFFYPQLFWQVPCMCLCVWNICPFFSVLPALFWLHLLISLAKNIPVPVSHFLSIFTQLLFSCSYNSLMNSGASWVAGLTWLGGFQQQNVSIQFALWVTIPVQLRFLNVFNCNLLEEKKI